MPVDIVWSDADKTVIEVRYVSPWTGSEMLQMVNTGIEMVNSVSFQIVDIIVDFHQATAQAPAHYLPSYQRLREVGRLNVGVVILVGAPFFIQSLSKMLRGLVPYAFKDLHFVTSIKIAQAVVSEQKQNRA